MSATTELRDFYASHVGERVTMTDNAVETSATLTECEQLDTDGTSFSLTFVDSTSVFSEQGTYLVTIGDAEPEPIFLVPAAPSTDGVTFYATFTSAPPKDNES